MALSLVISSLAARGWQGADRSPALACPFQCAKGLIHSPAQPWELLLGCRDPGSFLQSFCLTPPWIRPQRVSLLGTLNICAFPLLPLLLLPPSLPAPPHLHVPIQNKYSKSPCAFAKHRGEVCTKRKDDGFSFLCKGTLPATFFLWLSSRIFPKQISYLVYSLWDSSDPNKLGNWRNQSGW